MMSRPFIELTIRFHDVMTDAEDYPDRAERRLFNTAEIAMISPDRLGRGLALVGMRDGSMFIVEEPYEDLARMLADPRPAEPIIPEDDEPMVSLASVLRPGPP